MDAVMDTTRPTVTERYEQHVGIWQLEESPHNPRTHFDEAKLVELADSIRQKGIVEPLVVRQTGAVAGSRKAFEIVAGARRYRAAQLAGLETVPCIVRDYTDEDVLEVFVIENLQRDDLSPLEQARGFKQLLTANADRFTVATIASKVGMSPAWVWDRLKLLDLVPEGQALLEQGRITTGHAIVLARLKPEDQERVVDPDGRGLWRHAGPTLYLDEASYDADPYQDVQPVSIRELEAWVANHVRFDVEHMAQAVPLQFEELKQQVDEAQQAPGRGKKVISITYDHHVQPSAKDETDRTYGPESWRRADGVEDSQTCEHSVLGLVVVGPKQGSAFNVCIARDRCEVHFAEQVKAKRKAEKARAKGDTKTAAKVEKQRESSWERQERDRRERRAAWEALQPHVHAAAFEQVKRVKSFTPAQVTHFEEVSGFPLDRDVVREQLGRNWHEHLVAAILVSEVVAWATDFDAWVARIAKPLGLNLKPLLAVRDAHSPKAEPAAAAKPAAKKTSATKARGRK